MKENNMINTFLRKWGNSMAVRFPQSILSQLNLQEDAELEIVVEDGRLILSPVKHPKYQLKELLAQYTVNSRHDEISTGSPVGKELW
jgi:antitoxin MazE